MKTSRRLICWLREWWLLTLCCVIATPYMLFTVYTAFWMLNVVLDMEQYERAHKRQGQGQEN